MTMNTDKLESTGNVTLNKKGTSAHDLNELSDQELQLVTGGVPCHAGSFGCCQPGWMKNGKCPF
jgi:bacteriocin-like protein